MVDEMMLDVKRYLEEMALFVKTIKSEVQVVELISGWKIPENCNEAFPFLEQESVSINSGAVTLVDVVDKGLAHIKCGKEVTVILADNRQHSTKMEYFKCKVATDSSQTAVDIVNKAKVNFFEGKNYYDEDIL